ncbi:hypothetical protein OG234_13200 [Streptomyces sp. NBC_01420]|uniref:hypothetical protein n=1 Tax=Streptomyces sp. NBC_01420 TaxID=2903858 RepID=UPI00324E82A8
MTELIHVQPARPQLRDFARWATVQTPKIGTVGVAVFGVPPDLYVEAPEELLIGATVDGHRYVSPVEDAAEQGAGPRLLGCGLCYEEGGEEVHPHPECTEGVELLGVAAPDAFTGPGEPEADAAAMVAATPPEMVERAMTAALLATDLAASNAAGGGDGSDRSDPGHDTGPADRPDEGGGDEHAAGGDSTGPFPCNRCARSFRTERGRDSHRRQVHQEV